MSDGAENDELVLGILEVAGGPLHNTAITNHAATLLGIRPGRDWIELDDDLKFALARLRNAGRATYTPEGWVLAVSKPKKDMKTMNIEIKPSPEFTAALDEIRDGLEQSHSRMNEIQEQTSALKRRVTALERFREEAVKDINELVDRIQPLEAFHREASAGSARLDALNATFEEQEITALRRELAATQETLRLTRHAVIAIVQQAIHRPESTYTRALTESEKTVEEALDSWIANLRARGQ